MPKREQLTGEQRLPPSHRSTNKYSVHHNTSSDILDGIVYPTLGEVDLDPCDNETSIVVAKRKVRWPMEDGLKVVWGPKRVFCNPPWGDELWDWVRKMLFENKKNGAEIVAVIPHNESARWWDLVAAGFDAAFQWGPGASTRRVRYRGNKNGAPSGTCIGYLLSLIHI